MPFKKNINDNQSALWQIEDGPRGDGCTMKWSSKKKFPSLSNFAYKLTFRNKSLNK
jgi:hypothetical protein